MTVFQQHFGVIMIISILVYASIAVVIAGVLVAQECWLRQQPFNHKQTPYKFGAIMGAVWGVLLIITIVCTYKRKRYAK